MHKLTATISKNAGIRLERFLSDMPSGVSAQQHDVFPNVQDRIDSAQHLVERMSPNHDPSFHQVSTQASVPSIQMTPNQDRELSLEQEEVGSERMNVAFERMGPLDQSLQAVETITENRLPSIQREVGSEESANEESSTTTAGEQAEPSTPATQVCDRTLPDAELQQREAILQDLTRQFQINQRVREALISSMCDFSINQLQQMQQAGLRIWSRGSLPPAFSDDNIEIDTSQGGHAAYVRGIRTIFLTERVNSGFLTHEMAHAWDHIRILPRRHRRRLESMPRRARLRLIQNPGRYLSETNRAQQLSGEGPSASRRFTFSQMYQNYVGRLPRRELAFGRAAREGYSRESAQEFYAEGYAVFHGTGEYEQAKIYKYARELYIYLYDEANDENMPVPNLGRIRAEARRLPAPR